jgi:cell division protein FtsB
MTHLTMEQMVALREPGLEPGMESSRQHLAGCPECQAEADRLAQRIARLKALPTPRPGRDHFLQVRARFVAERRRRRLRWAGVGSLALAASAALAVLFRPGDLAQRILVPAGQVAAQEDQLQTMMARSQALEAALQAWDPDSRVLDGRTAAIAARLEDQLGTVDRRLEVVGALSRDSPAEQLRLWRERIGLLNALVDVHTTRASYAGM